jgi:hypothetical protein
MQEQNLMKQRKTVNAFLAITFAIALFFQSAIAVRSAPGGADYSFGFMGVKIDNDEIYNSGKTPRTDYRRLGYSPAIPVDGFSKPCPDE